MLETAVDKAAWTVTQSWTVIDVEDMAQDLWVHILEAPKTLKMLEEASAGQRHVLLVDIGHQIAKKKHKQDRVFHGAIAYSVNDVKDVLKRKTVTPHVLDDVSEAMDNMRRSTNNQYVTAIELRYGSGIVPTENAEKVVLSRAVEALTDEMNAVVRRKFDFMNEHEGPGSRVVISNAKAAGITKGSYD